MTGGVTPRALRSLQATLASHQLNSDWVRVYMQKPDVKLHRDEYLSKSDLMHSCGEKCAFREDR